MKHWRVSIDLEAEPEQAAQLRQLLPQFLQGQGYTTTSGTRTVEVWLAEFTEQVPPPFSGPPVHEGFLPLARTKRSGRFSR